MATSAQDFGPFVKLNRDGREEGYMVPDPATRIQSKDVVISPETGVSARLLSPKVIRPGQKCLLFLHFRARGLGIFDEFRGSFLSYLVRLGELIVVSADSSVDSSALMQWIAAHSNGQGSEPILNQHADFERVSVIGEGAGASMAHHVVAQAGAAGWHAVKVRRAIMLHPAFVGPEEDEAFKFMRPKSLWGDDEITSVDPNMWGMGSCKVLVCLAEKDELRSRGFDYYETLRKSGWGGSVELFETKGEDQCFHMLSPTCENARILINRLLSFIDHQ